jgi:orotidine-5'-phosphate decarboxylase
MKSNHHIRQVIQKKNSMLCVGLDTDPDKIPSFILKQNNPVYQFNRAIIDATHDLVAAYKPNLAFYEALGDEGWSILKQTVDYIPEGILKIGDAKRSDIGSTAIKYAKSLFDLGFDIVTVNPYLGWDSVGPFVHEEEKGVFVLCLTSNPSAQDFQYRMVEGRPFYQRVAEKVIEWNSNENCGLVVGATYPEELTKIREMAPDLPFLIPGIGAQGGNLESAVLGGTDSQGEMAIINSSRSILYASSDKNFTDAARREAKKLKDTMNHLRDKKKEKSE